MTDHIQLPAPDYTENEQGFVHDTQRHYYSEETMRAYAERLHAARVNGPAIMQAIGLLAVLQSWIGPRRPESSEPEEQALWDQTEATRIALTPLAPAGAPTTQAAPQPAAPQDWDIDAAVEKAWRRFQAVMEKGEPLPPPSVHVAAHYGTWLGREAHRHDEPKSGAFRNAARMLAVLDAEIRRLHAALIADQQEAPAAQGDAEVLSMSEALMLQRLADAENAARYALARRKIAIVNGEFRVLNLQPTGTAQYAEIEFDAAIDAARAQAKEGGA